MLSMANLRDGGHVVIGIDDPNVAVLQPGLQPGQLASWLGYDDLYYLTEVTELAARLALSDAGSDVMTIEATLRGLEGRGLVVGQSNRAEFVEPYRSRVSELTRSVTLAREVLVGEVRSTAVDMAHEFLARFGWQPSKQQLAEHQAELIEGR